MEGRLNASFENTGEPAAGSNAQLEGTTKQTANRASSQSWKIGESDTHHTNSSTQWLIAPKEGHRENLTKPINSSSTNMYGGISVISSVPLPPQSHNNNLSPTTKETVGFTLRSLRGVFLSFMSSAFFSLTAVIVKYLGDVGPGQLAVFRYLGILLFALPILMSVEKRQPMAGWTTWAWLLARGLAGTTSVYLRYCAFQLIPIANATVIVSCMPILTCVIARIFLKEPCGIFHAIALAITLVGIGCTSNISPSTFQSGFSSSDELWGLLASLGATLVGSTTYVIVRHLKGLHYSMILFHFSWVAIIESTLITQFSTGWKFADCGVSPWLLVLLGILSFYAQLLLTQALQVEEAGLVSVTRNASEVIFAFIFQIAFFGTYPNALGIVGAVLVMSAVLLTSARKYVMTLPPESTMRRILFFVTM